MIQEDIMQIMKGNTRSLLINEGRYHMFKNKTFKSKKVYNRKSKNK